MADKIGPAEGWRTRIWPFPKPAPKPEPPPAPAPDEPEKAPAALLRAWLLLRNTKIEVLRTVFTFVPLTVFFALTGMLVWVILILRGLVWAFRAILA